MPAPNVSLIDGLTERQRLAVDLLARGKTIREVARTLNVSERTIFSYRQKPQVQRAIFNTQQQLMGEAAGQNISVSPLAIQTLTAIVSDPEARDADRIAASKALLGHATAFTERRVLERQLADLEKQLVAVLSSERATRITPEIDDAEPLDPLLQSANPEDGDDE